MAWLKRLKTSPNWYVEWYDSKGQRRRKTTGTADKRLAEAFRRELENEQTKTRLGIQERSTLPPLATTIRIYLDYVAENLSPKTLRSYRRTLRIFCDWLTPSRLSTMTAADVQAADIELFYSGRRKDPGRKAKYVSDTTLAIDGRQLKAFFSWCMQTDIITRNPVKRIVRARKEPEHVLFMTDKEFARLLDAEPRRDLREVYRFMLLTGCRASEAAALTWEQIDDPHGLIYLTPQHRKRGRRHQIEISTSLAALIAEMRQRSNTPCEMRIWPLSALWISRKFREARKRARLRRQYHLHTLRHTAASHWIMAGVSMKAVADILGCSIAMIERHYGHLERGFKASQMDLGPMAKFGYAMQEAGNKVVKRNQEAAVID